jgi:two-component system, OmpR family, sensor kinase
MTAVGADIRRGNWAVQAWNAVRHLSDRTSLRTKLVVTLLVLVIIALGTIGTIGVSLLRGYLLGPTDNTLKSSVLQADAQQALSGSGSAQGFLSRAGFCVWWVPTSGTPQPFVQPQAQQFGPSQSDDLPAQSLTPIASWLAANPDVPTTVPGQAAGDRWRVIATSTGSLNGVPGSLVIGIDASSAYTTIRELAGTDLVVSLVIVLVLAVAGFVVVQANLRPLVEIEETAEEIAEGHLNRRVPERDPRTEIGSLGRSLNTMLSQIESAFHDREKSEAAAHKSEAAAHESEERMRRFIADASHELRTPLTTIRGFAEYYRQRGGLVQQWDEEEPQTVSGLSPADLDRIMHRVEAEAARMGLLVEDLLVLARVDQQRPLARKPVDLLTLAADAVHDSRMLAEDRDISLKVQPGAAFIVIGDEPRLRQVIGNLMSNALTHTPDGTSIEVLISSGTVAPEPVPDASPVPPTAAVVLEVKDYGPGMTPEQANRVFERFYRADQARTRATGGSGLGLAIVAALVAAHGGTASVETAQGQGATFRVVLPLAPEAQDWADDVDPDDEPEGVVPDTADFESGSADFGSDSTDFGPDSVNCGSDTAELGNVRHS